MQHELRGKLAKPWCSDTKMSRSSNNTFFFYYYYIYVLLGLLFLEDSGEMTGKYWVERGEQDQQRTSRRESNSGRYERSCATCRRTNHKAISADSNNIFWLWILHRFELETSLLKVIIWFDIPLELVLHYIYFLFLFCIFYICIHFKVLS